MNMWTCFEVSLLRELNIPGQSSSHSCNNPCKSGLSMSLKSEEQREHPSLSNTDGRCWGQCSFYRFHCNEAMLNLILFSKTCINWNLNIEKIKVLFGWPVIFYFGYSWRKVCKKCNERTIFNSPFAYVSGSTLFYTGIT